VELAWVEGLVAGYFPKFAGIANWRQSAATNAGARKQVRTRISRMIHILDNATDTSLFCLPVQANGTDAFKLALVRISHERLNSLDARNMRKERHKDVRPITSYLRNYGIPGVFANLSDESLEIPVEHFDRGIRRTAGPRLFAGSPAFPTGYTIC
jgi:hypothetical protein